jgi:hypothetical protein
MVFSKPNWTELNSQVVGAPRTSLLEEFSFLHNFRVVNNPLSNSPFITNKFNFEKNRFIDMDIQGILTVL